MKQKIVYREHEEPKEEQFSGFSSVASANECTGLMYCVPMDSDELESLEELSPMEIPRGEQDAEESLQAKLHRTKNAAETGRAVKEVTGEHSPGTPVLHNTQEE